MTVAARHLRPNRNSMADGGFGVYVHWPFCQSKCPYCDFNSHVRHAAVDQPRFARALARELATFADWHFAREPSSVFFGGGTPSLMEPATVAAVLDAINDTLGLPDGAEITLEANPTSVERARFEGFRTAGVNRLSLGMQSLNDEDLIRLGRKHDAAGARAALELAKRIFPSVSADFIYARPRQTLPAWRGELSQILAIAGDHLSLYQLTIEPLTVFHDLQVVGRLTVPDDDLAADLYDLTAEMTGEAGVAAYEVSNHARPGAEARHNLTYWRGGTYLGIGPGAHGRIVKDGRRTATATLKLPEAWLEAVERDGHGLGMTEPLEDSHVGQEYVLMGLRLAEGIDMNRYRQIAGTELDGEKVNALIADGLIVREGDRLAVPPERRLLTNAIIRHLLP